MDPYRPLVIDNRPAQGVFVDSNPLTDGIHNFAASLINAPLAAQQIEKQNAAQQLAQAWKQREYDRQTAQDALAQTWKQAEQKRQGEMDAGTRKWQEAQIANLDADNTRQNMQMLGNGANNAAARAIDALKLLFQGNKGGGATRAPERVNIGTPTAPDWRQWDEASGLWKPLPRSAPVSEQAAPAGAPAVQGQSQAIPGTNPTLDRVVSTLAPAPQQGGIPARPDWLKVDPQQEKAQQFVQLSGINPDPSTGINLGDILGPDDQRRIAALQRLPPLERKRAIAALRQLGHQ
jgi:hypothetical protein